MAQVTAIQRQEIKVTFTHDEVVALLSREASRMAHEHGHALLSNRTREYHVAVVNWADPKKPIFEATLIDTWRD